MISNKVVRSLSVKRPLTALGVGISVASLSISTITLIFSFILASGYGNSWEETHRQIVSAPMIDINNEKVSSQFDVRAEEIRKAASARSKLAPVRPLTNEESTHLIEVVQAQFPAKLSPAQVKAITSATQAPGQTIIDPTLPLNFSRSILRGQPPYQFLQADTDGSAVGHSIRFDTLRCYLSKDDREVTSMSIGLDGTISRLKIESAFDRANIVGRRTNIPTSRSFVPQWEHDEKNYLHSAIVTAAEFVVALILFFAGAAVLRGQPRWPLYHRIFVLGQLIVIIAASVLKLTEMARNDAQATSLLILVVVTVAYPVVLIFILPRSGFPAGGISPEAT